MAVAVAAAAAVAVAAAVAARLAGGRGAVRGAPARGVCWRQLARVRGVGAAGAGGRVVGEEEAEQVDSRDFVSRLMAEWSWRQTERHLRHFVNAIAALVCAAICMGFMLLVKGMALWQQVLVSLAVGAFVWLCIYLLEHLRKRWGRRVPVSSSA